MEIVHEDPQHSTVRVGPRKGRETSSTGLEQIETVHEEQSYLAVD